MEQTRRIASNPKMLYNLINSWVINGVFLGRTKRENFGRELGASVPQLLLIDPTSSCNLRCEGCWAGEYSKVDRLEPELFSRIIKEAKELGIYWIVLSGGEPFCYPYLLDVVAEHPDSVFMSYTNGRSSMRGLPIALPIWPISHRHSALRAGVNRLMPAGKGTFDKVMHAMDLLRERGVFFGASVTSMSNNINQIFSEEYIDFLVDKGATYMWSFHYIPIGRNPNVDLMLTPEQRLWMIDKVRELRNTRPILIADFWNDGEFTGGCIAGGRQYCHINAAGDVEPCAFVHFAVDNIKDKSLREVLQNPLFKAYQKRQPFNENHLAPCPIIDAPASLRELIKESGAKPTHRGAEEVLQGEVAEHLDQISKKWLELAGQYQEKNNKNEDTPVREGINAG